MPVSQRLRDSLRWGQEEVEELGDEFLDHKVFTYVETLGDLAREHGYEIEDDDIELSDAVLLALKREAFDHAQTVVNTYNSELDGFLKRNEALPRERILETYDAWAADRADAKSEIVAIQEAYYAAADATLAFYTNNGLEPAFDFGGHPELGDADPECLICQALVSTSPHPLARVLEVGSPHIGCRQDWHRSGDEEIELPEELELGRETAGIVGSAPFLGRHGEDREAAAAAILEMADAA